MKVDVILNVYGKPWQTLVSIKSLLAHSSKWIDKIYLTEEKFHPYDDSVKWICNHIENLIHFTPKDYYFIKGTSGDMNDPDNRWTNRYQYGIEKSDKDHVFIMHNDILFTGDIIGEMLGLTGENIAGVGLIGQCWNCSAFRAGKCNGEMYDKVDYTYDEVMKFVNEYPGARMQALPFIRQDKPMPMPECRLNEFACIIDRAITTKECLPNGTTPLFGSYDMLDLGDAWFRNLVDKGYKFKYYDINRTSRHGYFSQIEDRNYLDDKTFYVSGYPTQLTEKLYWEAEIRAKEYFKNNYL